MLSASKKNKIFLSYRRGNDAGITNYIQKRLSEEFGDRRVFMDTRKIQIGENFVNRIEKELKFCESFIAVIGRDWFKRISNTGGQNLNPLRAEISAALKLNLKIFPVLVNGANLPTVEELPSDIQELSYIHSIEIRESSIDYDIDQLISAIKGKSALINGPVNRRKLVGKFFLHFIFAFFGAILAAYLWYIRAGNIPQPRGIPGYVLLIIPSIIVALLLMPNKKVRFIIAFLMGAGLFLAEIAYYLI